MMDAVYPPPGMVYAAVWEGISLFCDRDLMLHHLPSALTDDLAEEPTVPGRRVLLHAMYSVTDRLAFAVWEDAMLRRSLSVAPDDGVIENLGKPFDFEEPFWAGRRPVPPDEDDPRPYPLPFHPLDLGEEALRSLFGFCLECRLGPDDVDPERITVHGFRVTDPAPRTEPARRDSLSAARVVRFDADGTLIIVEDD